MKHVALVLALAGCKSILGIEGTSVAGDAPADQAIDAAPFTVDVGNGADGPLVVSATSYTDEDRAALAETVGAGSTLVKLTSVLGFDPGEEVVIIQMIGEAAGQHETRRIATTGATTITLDKALDATYVAEGVSKAQVIRVPNYQSVTIPTGVLTAHDWDGATGGVVFFRAMTTVEVASAGSITADAIGFGGGAAGVGAVGGEGGAHGFGAGPAQCPILGCTNTAAVGGFGSPGQTPPGKPGGAGIMFAMCRGGSGGAGGGAGLDALPPVVGGAGEGPGGALANGGPGTNTSSEVDRPMLGGGGAGGDGGAGGRGGGGGGGGGGPVSSSGQGGNGGKGGAGGDGGAGGAGGRGGGIVSIHAASIMLAGTISARGGAATMGLDATDGNEGGTGGNPGFGALCGGLALGGGRGGGGVGAYGGNGGNGGGGGGGGVAVVNARTITVTGGDAFAVGGTQGTGGPEGALGIGGDGFDGRADSGMDGVTGAFGTLGNVGFFYMRTVESCTGCEIGDPPVVVIDLL